MSYVGNQHADEMSEISSVLPFTPSAVSMTNPGYAQRVVPTGDSTRQQQVYVSKIRILVASVF